MTKINCHSHKVAPPISNRFALSHHKRAESIPCAGYRVHRPQAQRTNGHSWQLLRCSKHMVLQAHGMPHVSRVVKHVILIVQSIGKLGIRSGSGHANEFAECVCRSKFPPPHMYLVVAGQWNFMVYRCDQIGSAYNAALSTLSYLVRARLGNPTLSGISCRAKTWTHFSWWARPGAQND